MKTIILIFTFQLVCTPKLFSSENTIVQVEYPETYELANIILALTDYGKTDKWQVRKGFQYYEEMASYFEPYSNHPLIDSVNFSKEKWKEYLSFRTDSYAFIFNDKGNLERVNDFQSFEIKTFDKYIGLIQDFSDKSNFRQFYANHKEYYDIMIDNYYAENKISDMLSFLTSHFGDFYNGVTYKIVISPFVYAQNLHRDIDSTEVADFITVSDAIVQGNVTIATQQKSIEVHSLFTELNHGFINPVSEQKNKKIKRCFKEDEWEVESGYTGYTSAVFNEYMTWAVYDIFNKEYFPSVAKENNLYWHFQNASRGFIYSQYFAAKLAELYFSCDKTIGELYPQMLKWCKSVESSLSQPVINVPRDSLICRNDIEHFVFEFSEPLENIDSFHVLIETDDSVVDTLLISDKNNLKWSSENTRMEFDLELPKIKAFYITFNWWGTSVALYSKKGILLKPNSYLKIINETYN